MGKIRKCTWLKALLPLLFIAYYSGSTSFWHVHRDGERIVVHSHPYTSGSSSNPNHSHSTAGFQLVHVLTAMHLLLGAASLLAAAFLLLLRTVHSKSVRMAVPACVEYSRLRGPPSGC